MLSTPVSFVLHSFFFPDEQSVGSPRAAISLDAATGLSRITLPAGPVAVRIDHQAPIPSVRFGRMACALGVLMLLLLVAISLRPIVAAKPLTATIASAH